MEKMEKKKIVIGAILGIALLGVTSYFMWFRKPKQVGDYASTATPLPSTSTIADKKPIKQATVPYSYTTKSFDGSDEDLRNELYQKIVGTALYIDDAKDINSKKLKSMIADKADQHKMSYWDCLKAYLISHNKGEDKLKDVIKSIGNDLEKHVIYVRKRGNFMTV